MASAACTHIFDNPLDLDPPLLFDQSTHLFSPLDLSDTPSDLNLFKPYQHRRSASLSSANSESLSEALGFESFDDVEGFDDQWEQRHDYRQTTLATTAKSGQTKRSRISGKEIPPPISSIGRRVCFKSYRYNGRLILKEVKIPTQELLHAYREDGRLKLQFVQFDDEIEIERGNEEKVGAENQHNCDEADDNTKKNEIREE